MRLNVVSGVLSFQFKAAFFTAITVDSSSSSFTDLDQFKAKLKNNNGPKSARLLNDSEASKGVTNCQRRRFSFKVCQRVFFLFTVSFFVSCFLVSVFCFIRVRLETFFSCHCLFRVSSTTLASSSSSTLDICTTRSKKSANTSLTIELDLHIKLNIE